MKKHKKLIVLLVTLCLSFTFTVTGCTDAEVEQEETTAPEDTSTPEEDSLASESEETLEEVTLKWVLGGPGRQRDSDMVWEYFNNQLQDYLPNTTVEFESIPNSEYRERWDLMMAAGEEIDIAWHGWMIPFAEEVAKGSYLELDELIDSYAPGIRMEIPEWVLDIGAVDGVTYAIPNYQQMTELRQGLRTHQELADQYWDVDNAREIFYQSDLPYRAPTQDHYNEIESYLEALKDNGEIRLGFSQHILREYLVGTEIAGPAIVRLPRQGEDFDFTVYNRYELPEYKMFYDVMADWFQKGYIRQDILSLSNPREDEGREDGYIAWFHGYFEGTAESESSRYGFPIEVVPMEENYYISRLTSPTSVAIPRTANNPERAMMFIEFMHIEEGAPLYNTLVWGIEGEHYEKVSDNRVETLHYDGGQGSADHPYGLPGWMMGNTFNLWSNQATAEGWNEYIENEVHGNAIVSPIIGFKPDPDPVRTEIAQCDAVVAEFDPSLLSGALSNHEEIYDEFIDKLKEAGVDRIVEEMQRQIDDYLDQQGISR